MDLKSKIILIYGQTASGKSNFAIKLAKKIKGEIVNADSMQVYKELKILSARPIPKNYLVHSGDTSKDLDKIKALSTKERSQIQTFPKNFIFYGRCKERNKKN